MSHLKHNSSPAIARHRHHASIPLRKRWLLVCLLGFIGVTIVYHFSGWGIRSAVTSHNPLAVTTTNSDSISRVIDYTDPLDVTRNLFYGTYIRPPPSLTLSGPWKAQIPSTVVAGEEFTMQFSCLYPEKSLCPPYYMVFFHGPSRQSVLPDAFTSLNWTVNSPHEFATVQATWTIHDPGHYNVYIYPQFVYCDIWQDMEFPWEKAAVQDTPFQLTVQPSPHATTPDTQEGYGTCTTSEEIDHGRYLSTNISSNPRFTSMYAHSGRHFIWKPYTCNIPVRNIHEALDLIPSAKHFMFLGDSTTRGGFCTRIWQDLHGSVAGSVCDYKTDDGTVYWDLKWGHKFTSVLLEKNDNRQVERNVSFSFLWLADNFTEVGPTLLSLTEPPPSHVVFNMGL